MKVTGECLCGSVKFSAEIDESKVIICHCTDCQVQGSAPFRIGTMVHRDTFSMQGEVTEYCKIGTSGARRMQVFCPKCATPIYSHTPDSDSPMLSMRLGAVHQRAQLKPSIQIWGRSKLPWLDDLASIPCVMEQDVLAAHLKK